MSTERGALSHDLPCSLCGHDHTHLPCDFCACDHSLRLGIDTALGDPT